MSNGDWIVGGGKEYLEISNGKEPTTKIPWNK